MLQSEFTKRVGMEVSNAEFNAINVVYMASDLDKDEFCAMWRKMNSKRIKAYKSEKKEEREMAELAIRIKKIYKKLSKCEHYYIYGELTEKEEKDIVKFGIELEEIEPIFGHKVPKRILQVKHEIFNKFNGDVRIA